MQTLAQPPPTVRMQSGRVVPAQTNFGIKPKPKKFLVVIQHYDGDVSSAEELACLIADLERTRNHDADILVMRRADSRELDSNARMKLESKFDKVHLHVCRRSDAKGHPWGCNSMFYDLVALMAMTKPFRDDYYAFINLEPDAVPTRPGWIGELIEAWRTASQEGASLIGYFQKNPSPHINGLAVYAADIGNRVGARKLAGGSPQVPFDIRHGATLVPMAKETPLIYFSWRKPTVTPEELFGAKRDGIEPVIYHGVKDESARLAVRARHISMTAPATKRPNVYTYFPQTNMLGNTENQSVLDVWRQGWLSRGWNPVVLSKRDAVKATAYAEFKAAVEKLPCAHGDKIGRNEDFFRWLALDSAGGGMLVGVDVLPKDFVPTKEERARVYRSRADGPLLGAYMSAMDLFNWIERILKYDAQPDDVLGEKPHVTDDTIARRAFETSEVVDALVHFDAEKVGNQRRSSVMEAFLRGE